MKCFRKNNKATRQALCHLSKGLFFQFLRPEKEHTVFNFVVDIFSDSHPL